MKICNMLAHRSVLGVADRNRNTLRQQLAQACISHKFLGVKINVDLHKLRINSPLSSSARATLQCPSAAVRPPSSSTLAAVAKDDE